MMVAEMSDDRCSNPVHSQHNTAALILLPCHHSATHNFTTSESHHDERRKDSTAFHFTLNFTQLTLVWSETLKFSCSYVSKIANSWKGHPLRMSTSGKSKVVRGMIPPLFFPALPSLLQSDQGGGGAAGLGRMQSTNAFYAFWVKNIGSGCNSLSNIVQCNIFIQVPDMQLLFYSAFHCIVILHILTKTIMIFFTAKKLLYASGGAHLSSLDLPLMSTKKCKFYIFIHLCPLLSTFSINLFPSNLKKSCWNLSAL